MVSFRSAFSWGAFFALAQDLANAAHEGHLRQSAAVSGRGGLPISSGGDDSGKVPAAMVRSRAAAGGAAATTHLATNHDSKQEKLRLGGQGEETEEEAFSGSGDEDQLPAGVAEEDTEWRDAGLDAFDLVAMDVRRLTTSGSASADLYPNCTISLEIADGTKIGDNYCDQIFNNADCGYDGGDCCECDCGLQPSEPASLGSSSSSSSLQSSSNYTCGVNGYICVDPASECFEDLYPDCVSRGGTLEWIGNGACWWANNNEACGYDGGDCCECDCVGNLESRCGVNGYDCIDPLSPSECPEEVPTPSPQARPLTSSPVDITPSVITEGGDDGDSDDSVVTEIVIGVASTVVGGVVLGLVTKHCLGERGSSSSSG